MAKFNKLEIAKRVNKAIEWAKEDERIFDVVADTEALNITCGEVLQVIDSEDIEWFDMKNATVIDEPGAEHINTVVGMIDNNGGKYNICVRMPSEVEEKAEDLCDLLDGFKRFLIDEVEDTYYCDMPTSHEVLRYACGIAERAKELSDLIEELD